MNENAANEGFTGPVPFDINAHLVKNRPSTYLMTVSGDSMTGAGILDGDKVVVDKAIKPAHKDIVIAVVNRGFVIKRLYQEGAVIELRSENPTYPNITVKEGSLEIWGVVVGMVRKMTR